MIMTWQCGEMKTDSENGMVNRNEFNECVLRINSNNNNKEFILTKNTCRVCFNELNDLLA